MCVCIYKTKATQRKYRQKRKGETWLALSTLLPASCAITQQATGFCNILVGVALGLLWNAGTPKAGDSAANSPRTRQTAVPIQHSQDLTFFTNCTCTSGKSCSIYYLVPSHLKRAFISDCPIQLWL